MNPPRRSAGACVTLACLAIAGCNGHAATPPPTPSPSFPATSSCRLLTHAEVQSALGIPIEPAKAIGFGGCLFSIPDGAGEVDFGVTAFKSASLAQEYVKQQAPVGSSCCKVSTIRDLGQLAVTITGKTEGTSVLAVFGSRVLTVNISWNAAITHPGMALTLAREAAGRL